MTIDAWSEYVGQQAKDEALLEVIRGFQDAHGFAPTVRELQDGMGVASVSTVYLSLQRLRQAGRLTWVEGKSRTLKVVDGDQLPDPTVRH